MASVSGQQRLVPFSLGRGDNFRVDGLTDDLVTQSCVRVVGGPGPAAAHECD